MTTLLISLLTLVLLLISAFVVLIVLMQRTSQNGGMGAALGGGAAESAFGSETNNILTKGTVYGIIAFFLVALSLYLLYQAQAADRVPNVEMEALISAEAAEATDASETVVESAAAELDGETLAVEGTELPGEGSLESDTAPAASALESTVESTTESAPESTVESSSEESGSDAVPVTPSTVD